MTPDQIRSFFRAAEWPYTDSEETEEGKWDLRFWMPIHKYRFDDREGLSTNITLHERVDDNQDFSLLSMRVWGLYETTDMSLEQKLLERVNSYNRRWKCVKWTLETGKNLRLESDGVMAIQVNAMYDIPLNGNGTLEYEQFWRSHAALWSSITESWEDFSSDLGISNQIQNIDYSQADPENLSNADKEKLIDMFGKYLDEQFENS